MNKAIGGLEYDASKCSGPVQRSLGHVEAAWLKDDRTLALHLTFWMRDAAIQCLDGPGQALANSLLDAITAQDFQVQK